MLCVRCACALVLFLLLGAPEGYAKLVVGIVGAAKDLELDFTESENVSVVNLRLHGAEKCALPPMGEDGQDSLLLVIRSPRKEMEDLARRLAELRGTVKAVITYIDHVGPLSIRDVLVARGIISWSNVILTKSKEMSAMLQAVYGLPGNKITVLTEEKEGGKQGKRGQEDDSGKKKQPQAFSDASLLGNIVKASTKSLDLSSGRVFVLYSDSNVHVNVTVVKGKITDVWIRHVKEQCAWKDSLPVAGTLSGSLTEGFVHIRKGGPVRMFNEVPRVLEYNREKGRILANTPSVKVAVNRRTLEVTISGRERLVRGRGALADVLRDGEGPAGKWALFVADKNFYEVRHPMLVDFAGGAVGSLYRRPRRSIKECFDPSYATKELQRFCVSGHYDTSGMALVNRYYILGMRKFQNMLVERVTYTHRWKLSVNNYEDYLVSVHMLECCHSPSSPGNTFLGKNPRVKFAKRGIEVRNSYPVNLAPVRDGFKAVIQFPWEFSEVPLKWTKPIVDMGFSVWVPSKYCKDVHSRAGINPAKITVIPHGIPFADMDLLTKIVSRKKAMQQSKQLALASPGRVKFVVVSGSLARKGIDVAIKAYMAAFTKGEPVVLRIHCMYGDRTYTEEVKSLVQKNAEAGGPRIIYTEGYIDGEKIRGLLSDAHYMVLPFRGEGFGLTILESMAYGTVPIVTNYGPALEICSNKDAFFIPCKEARCTKDPVSVNGDQCLMFGFPMEKWPLWAEPSTQALTRILKRAFKICTKAPKRYRKLQRAGRKSARVQAWSLQFELLRRTINKESQSPCTARRSKSAAERTRSLTRARKRGAQKARSP